MARTLLFGIVTVLVAGCGSASPKTKALQLPEQCQSDAGGDAGCPPPKDHPPEIPRAF